MHSTKIDDEFWIKKDVDYSKYHRNEKKHPTLTHDYQ